MVALPGWLTKRARDAGYTSAHVLLAPAEPTSAAIYLLEGDGAIAPFELHVVSDAVSGIDGATVQFSRSDAVKFLLALSGGLAHRVPGEKILPFETEPAAEKAETVS